MRKTIYIMPLLFLCLHVTAQSGQPDMGFGTGLNVKTDFGNGNEQAWAIAVQPDGKVLVAGFSGNGGHLELTNNFDIAVARYNTNGTLDNTFSGDGKFTLNIAVNDQAHGIAVQSDGKIIVVGKAGTDFAVLRLNSNGTLDNTFDGDGWLTTHINPGINQANAILIQSDGKYLVTGSGEGGPNNSDFVTIRYNTDGTLDNTFDGDGISSIDIIAGSDDYPLGMAIQSNGKIVLSGTSIVGNGLIDVSLVRLNADGTPDNTFGGGDGIVTTDINTTDIGYDVAIDANGKIVVGGSSSSLTYRDDDITRDFMVIRYNANGTLDNTFGGTGIVITDLGANNDDKGNDIAIQANGKIVIGGYSDRTTNHDYSVARYNTNGTLDNTFDGDGIASFPPAGDLTVGIAMKLMQNRIYLAGTTYSGGVSDFSIIAFQNDGNTLPLTLLSFNASKQNTNIQLQWQTEKEINILGFDLQRSADGKTFKTIGYSQPMADNGVTKKNYTYVDNQPFSAVNYYRLVIKDIDGSMKYSKILAIKNSSASQELEVFPSLASNTLQIQLPAGLTGKTNVQISDVAGRLIKTIVLEPKGYAVSTSVDVSSLNKGVYFVVVKGENNVKMTAQFMKN